MAHPLALMTIVAGMACAAIVDLRTRRVPNVLTLSIAIAGVALAAGGVGPVTTGAAVSGAVVGLLLMLPGHLLGGTGAGDVKLFAAAGTLLGPGGTVVAFLATAIAGGFLALTAAVRRGRLARSVDATVRLVATGGASVEEIDSPQSDNRFAYAPAIAIGATLAAFVR